MANFDPCLVHIPNKDWSGDKRDFENWLEVERWALRLKSCGSSCSCGATLMVQFGEQTGLGAGPWDLSFSSQSIDPNALGQDGMGVLSWDGDSFSTSEVGQYSMQGYVEIANVTNRGTDQTIVGYWERWDTGSDTGFNSVGRDGVSLANPNGGGPSAEDPSWMLTPKLTFPLPVGGAAALIGNAVMPVGSWDIVNAYILATKVSCCENLPVP